MVDMSNTSMELWRNDSDKYNLSTQKKIYLSDKCHHEIHSNDLTSLCLVSASTSL
jgi:hypothetical protein